MHQMTNRLESENQNPFYWFCQNNPPLNGKYEVSGKGNETMDTKG